jgi:hypothetical protein
MDDFIKQYWTDKADFLDAELGFENTFQKLAKKITWDEKYNQDFQISSVAALFKQKKSTKPKNQFLKKYSFFEFLERRQNIKNKTEKPKQFLSKLLKIGTLNLSNRKFKIIDYGNCYDYSDERYGLINTRQYRAPEVILSKP